MMLKNLFFDIDLIRMSEASAGITIIGVLKFSI